MTSLNTYYLMNKIFNGIVAYSGPAKSMYSKYWVIDGITCQTCILLDRCSLLVDTTYESNSICYHIRGIKGTDNAL